MSFRLDRTAHHAGTPALGGRGLRLRPRQPPRLDRTASVSTGGH
ncbi:MAG TPA: hypothetical protein VF598_09060 [Hymenobacter sp.]